MMSGLISVSYFLLSLFFTLALFLLWTRIFLRYFRISMVHPVSQMVFQLTHPILGTFDKRAYRAKRPIHYDYIALVAIIIVEICKFLCFGFLAYQIALPIHLLLVFVIADLIVQPLNYLFWAMIIRVVMSWLNPQLQMHPIAQYINIITNPLLRLGHKIIPDISGFDFAPFVVIIFIKVISLFISASMPLPLL